MAFRFCVLGSGSAGNATLIETQKTKLLIDMGFSHDAVTERLRSVTRSNEDITHILLTHCHADHIRSSALRLCRDRQIQLLCHASHDEILEVALAAAQLDTREMEICAAIIGEYQEEGAIHFDPMTSGRLPMVRRARELFSGVADDWATALLAWEKQCGAFIDGE